jgi:DNA/RNA endonuclease YhcR with UshA esterase domain
MTGLLVEQVQLPDPKGENTAVTLYCTQEGIPVTLRLEKAGEGMDPSSLVGKRIDVKGLVDCFAGSYQIRILSNQGIIIEN